MKPIVRFYENHAQDSRVKSLGQVCETVSRKWGTGGGNVPLVMEARDGRSCRSHDKETR